MAPSHGVCQLEASVPLHVNLPTGYLHVLPIWQAAFPQMSGLREQSRNCNVSYNLALEITYHHCFNISLVTQASPIQCERGLHKSMNSRGSSEPSWRLATTLPHRSSRLFEFQNPSPSYHIPTSFHFISPFFGGISSSFTGFPSVPQK